MDRRYLAHLDLWRSDSKPGLVGAVLWNAPGLSERDVCLHLAFF